MHNFERIKQIIQFLDRNQYQSTLEEISAHLKISTYQLRRLFSQWAATTPEYFLERLTARHVRSLLKNDVARRDATLNFGSPVTGQLHSPSVSIEVASPDEIKSGGEDMVINVGFADSPFGYCLIAETKKGICHISFESTSSKNLGISVIRSQWPNAEFNWSNDGAAAIAWDLFTRPNVVRADTKLKTFVIGTDFQIRVWRALLRLPGGHLSTYGAIASEIGQPKSSRAVGTAIGKNPIAYLIPCHRVIRSTGVFGEYRWGAERKKAIVAWESSCA